MLKKSTALLALVAVGTTGLLAKPSQAAVVYSQDFSASNPVDESGTVVAIVDDTLYDSSGQNITGGNAAAQATDGDYTIDLINSTSGGNGFIFNPNAAFAPAGQSANGNPGVSPLPGAGFAAIDTNYTFTTGSITIDNQGSSASGTVSIFANALNVGGEFLSLNLIQIEENDATGEVVLTIDYNAFGDFAPGGNEDIQLTTTFGLASDVTSLDIAPVTDANNVAIEEVYTLVLVPGIPEPSSLALISLGGLLIARRRRTNLPN